MKAVVLAEKASAKRNLAKAFGGNKGSFEGVLYTIVALRGHLYEFVEPHEMVSSNISEFYRQWSLDTLPWNAKELTWEKQLKSSELNSIIKELNNELKDADELIIATDYDPSGEGDLLAWEVIDALNWKRPVSRMRFPDESVASLQKAFKNRTIISNKSSYSPYLMADTRSKWDYLSMQFTRAASVIAQQKGYRLLLRQGRLKSVIVKFVGDQESLIQNWVKKPFWELRYKDTNNNIFKVDESKAERYDNSTNLSYDKNEICTIVVDDSHEKRSAPPKLPDLIALSAALAKKGYKPKTILKTYQTLYEDQFVSYPRTEDKLITQAQFDELEQISDEIARVCGIDPKILTHRKSRPKHITTTAAHGANRPGPKVPLSLEELDKYGEGAKDIYVYLARRWLALLMPDYEYLQSHAHLKEHPEYKSTSEIPQKQGFKTLLTDLSEDEKDDDTNKKLFGKTATPFSYEGSNKKPPAPSINWLRKMLEKYDVGTGATRTSTIAEISEGDTKALLCENRGKLNLSETGKVSYQLTRECLISDPERTAELFRQIKEVGQQKVAQDKVLQSIPDMLLADIATMKKAIEHIPSLKSNTTIGSCPRCGKDVVYKTNGSSSCTSNHWTKTGDKFVLDSGCGFIISKVYGHPLDLNETQSLLIGNKVHKTIKGKFGKQQLEITLDPTNDYGIRIQKRAGDIVGKCPRCGKDVVYKTNGSSSCTSNHWTKTGDKFVLDSGCGFRLGTVWGKKLSKLQATQLLGQGTIVVSVKGKFDSKSSKRTIKLDPQNDWGFTIESPYN